MSLFSVLSPDQADLCRKHIDIPYSIIPQYLLIISNKFVSLPPLIVHQKQSIYK